MPNRFTGFPSPSYPSTGVNLNWGNTYNPQGSQNPQIGYGLSGPQIPVPALPAPGVPVGGFGAQVGTQIGAPGVTSTGVSSQGPLAGGAGGVAGAVEVPGIGGGTGGWMDRILGGVKGTFWNPASPGENGQPGTPGSFNLPAIGDLVKGIGTFGALSMGFEQNRQARDALDFQKKAYGTNLANSISSYNLALEDRVRARHAQQGTGQDAAEAYINKYRLEA